MKMTFQQGDRVLNTLTGKVGIVRRRLLPQPGIADHYYEVSLDGPDGIATSYAGDLALTDLPSLLVRLITVREAAGSPTVDNQRHSIEYLHARIHALMKGGT